MINVMLVLLSLILFKATFSIECVCEIERESIHKDYHCLGLCECTRHQQFTFQMSQILFF